MRVLLLVDGLWELWSGTFCLVCSRVSLPSSPVQSSVSFCTAHMYGPYFQEFVFIWAESTNKRFQHVVLAMDTRMLMCYKDSTFDAFTLHMAFSTLKQRGCWLWTAAWRHSMPCYVRAQKAWAITGRLRNAEKPSLREFGRKRDEHTGLFLCNIVVKTGWLAAALVNISSGSSGLWGTAKTSSYTTKHLTVFCGVFRSKKTKNSSRPLLLGLDVYNLR